MGTADGVTAYTESAAVPVLRVHNQISVSVAAALVSEKVQEALWIHYRNEKLVLEGSPPGKRTERLEVGHEMPDSGLQFLKEAVVAEAAILFTAKEVHGNLRGCSWSIKWPLK